MTSHRMDLELLIPDSQMADAGSGLRECDPAQAQLSALVKCVSAHVPRE